MICPSCKLEYPEAAPHSFCARDGAYLVAAADLAHAGGDRLLGRRVGEFAVAARIGAGAMGTVYRAIQVGVDRTVALKVLHPQLLRNRDLVQRFFLEARAMAQLQHRHLATTYTSGATEDGLLYIAMEYVAGGSLRQLIDRSLWSSHPGPSYRLGAQRALTLWGQVLSGVARAHRQGVVHRDLKPDNVLLQPADEEEGEQAKVVDFGLAKILGADRGLATRAGARLGTPLYMAPELLERGGADPRADVYALGLLLYELLCGFLPFDQARSDRDEPQRLLGPRLLQPIPPPPAPISAELGALCLELLDPDPARRPVHAAAARERLRSTPEGRRWPPINPNPSQLVPAERTVPEGPRPPPAPAWDADATRRQPLEPTMDVALQRDRRRRGLRSAALLYVSGALLILLGVLFLLSRR